MRSPVWSFYWSCFSAYSRVVQSSMESWQQKWSSCEGIEIEGVSKCLSGGGEFPVFTYRPSWEEFQDFQACIRRAEAMGAHKTGICKVCKS